MVIKKKVIIYIVCILEVATKNYNDHLSLFFSFLSGLVHFNSQLDILQIKKKKKKKKLSHLFFASDSLIFCKASLAERESLQRVLKVYEQASGQQLNWAKTSLFFTSNASREVQEEIKRRFGAQVIKQHGSTWVYKEVLIKAVTQAIPTYIMSCFKILDYLCEDLTSMIRNFLWRQRKEEKKIAWL